MIYESKEKGRKGEEKDSRTKKIVTMGRTAIEIGKEVSQNGKIANEGSSETTRK